MLTPARYFQIDNFLSQSEHVELLDDAIALESQFTASTTSTGVVDYRKSMVLYQRPALADAIVDRVCSLLPRLWLPLGVAPFEMGEIEAQITAHNDGCYYRTHNDNGSEHVATRTVSYVYYFYREPQGFEGGELRIYDRGNGQTAKSYSTIYPRNNSVVLFASDQPHEVCPVVCPSRSFAESRFTFNGWIRRAVD